MSIRSGAIPAPPLRGVLVVVLLIAAVVVALGGHQRGVSGTGVRAAVPLLVVGPVGARIVRRPTRPGLFVAVKFAVAAPPPRAGSPPTAPGGWPFCRSVPASRRSPGPCCPVAPSARTALVVVPLGGQLTLGCPDHDGPRRARLSGEPRQRHGEIEAGLSPGMTDREARLKIARPAAGGAALVPALDQNADRTVTCPTPSPDAFRWCHSDSRPARCRFVLISLLASRCSRLAGRVSLVVSGWSCLAGRGRGFLPIQATCSSWPSVAGTPKPTPAPHSRE